MTTKSIATALALGCLAFTLSVLPVTTAEAKCRWLGEAPICGSPKCSPGEETRIRIATGGYGGSVSEGAGTSGNLCITGYKVLCCTPDPKLPSEPYATGETKAEQEQREVKECAAMGGRYDPQKTPRCSKRPVKNIGKSKTTGESASTDETPAALKPIRDCRAKGWRWDQSAGKCIKPSEAKAECEAKGQKYNLDTGRCIKQIGKAKAQGAPDQAEEQSSSEQASDEDDYKPKNKNKKKKQRDYDDD